MWRRVRYILALLALCAIATCPAAKRSCTAKNRAQEADDLLGVLADQVAATVAMTGHVPLTPAGPSPQPSCCEQGGECKPDAAAWTAPGWRDLQFSVDGAHRYTYQYLPDPSGSFAVVRATGDLDCNGTSSLYEVKLTVHGLLVERAWSRKDPYE
ncbi:MAG: hypothetical protein JWO36_5917 [Myxococcales bacterium]|nr:hypothetical protein [Myxococcales bacterium]